MTERGLLVVRLLRARFDWLAYVPVKRSAECRPIAVHGAVAATWEECPRCSGRGVVGQGRAERECDRCKGQKRVLVDRMLNRDASKAAIERERVTGEAESAKLHRQRIDGMLRRLARDADERSGKLDPTEREKWEQEKERLRSSGSFRELDRALLLLEKVDPYGRAAVEVVYGYDSPLRTVGVLLQQSADRAVERVAGWMPSTIRVPERVEPKAAGTGRWANGHAQQQRDREIWRLHTVDGLNREQISKRLGIDRSTVSRVLAAKVAA